VLLILVQSVYIVDQRSKVLVFSFGEVKRDGGTPGLHFKKPFFETVGSYDARALTLDSRTQTVNSADGKSLEIQFDMKWQIADVMSYYRATGGQDLVATGLLSDIVVGRIRETFGALTLEQALASGGTGAGDLAATLLSGTTERLAELGIRPIDIRITGIGIPKDNVDKVYERMRAERNRVASDLRGRGFEEADKIRAEADRTAETTLADAYRDAEKTRGEGDAKAAEISAKAYGQDADFYAFYRSLNAYREAFKDKQDVLVVEPKGEFFKYFKQSDGGK
jgi:membrane protease subunit HflC